MRYAAIIIIVLLLMGCKSKQKVTKKKDIKIAKVVTNKRKTPTGDELWRPVSEKIELKKEQLIGSMKGKDDKVIPFKAVWSSIRRYGRSYRIEFSNKAPNNPKTPIVRGNNAFHLVLAKLKPNTVFKKALSDKVDKARYNSYFHVNQKGNVSYELPHGNWSVTLRITEIKDGFVQGDIDLIIKDRSNKQIVGSLKGYFKAKCYPKNLLDT